MGRLGGGVAVGPFMESKKGEIVQRKRGLTGLRLLPRLQDGARGKPRRVPFQARGRCLLPPGPGSRRRCQGARNRAMNCPPCPVSEQAPGGAPELEHGGSLKKGEWPPGHGAAAMGEPYHRVNLCGYNG